MFVFGPWNSGDHSHHDGSFGREHAVATDSVRTLDRLDVHDVGTEHGEVVADDGAGPERGEVGDPEALERHPVGAGPAGDGARRTIVFPFRARVLAEARGRFGRTSGRVVTERVRNVGLEEPATRVRDVELLFHEVVEGGNRLAVPDRGNRHPQETRELHDLVGGAQCTPRANLGLELLAPLGATRVRVERLVVEPLAMADHRAERLPHHRGGNHEPHPAVGGALDRGNVHVASPAWPEDGSGLRRHRPAGDRVHVHREREHLEHGHVEQLTDARLP